MFYYVLSKGLFKFLALTIGCIGRNERVSDEGKHTVLGSFHILFKYSKLLCNYDKEFVTCIFELTWYNISCNHILQKAQNILFKWIVHI